MINEVRGGGQAGTNHLLCVCVWVCVHLCVCQNVSFIIPGDEGALVVSFLSTPKDKTQTECN